MGLRINSAVGKLPKIIFFAGVTLIATGLVKTAVWEHLYYSNQEGQPRASASETRELTAEAIDETEITETEIQEYTVATDKPRYLSIPKLNIVNSRMREVGLTNTGRFGTLASIYDTAWYHNSSKPGAGGTILANGHNGGPTKDGVFKRLDTLSIGDIIIIERGDGEIFNYEVYENKALPLKEADGYMRYMLESPIPGIESLSLITCSGDWSQSEQTYMSRSMLRATLLK